MRVPGPGWPRGGLASRLQGAAVRWIAALVTAVLLALVHAFWGHHPVAPHEPSGSPSRLEGRARVVDGDTLALAGTRIRLLGIDAPELDQTCEDASGAAYPCGLMARDALAGLVDGPLVCRGRKRDRYRRLLATCLRGTTDIGRAMVRQGWAVDLKTYAAEQDQARSARLGIWAGDFEEPAQWRREKRLEGWD